MFNILIYTYLLNISKIDVNLNPIKYYTKRHIRLKNNKLEKFFINIILL